LQLADLELPDLSGRLKTGELVFRIGEFDVCLKTSLPSVVHNVRMLYPAYPLLDRKSPADFYLELKAPGVLRHFVRPQVCFYYDGIIPFKPLPMAQAFAMFEWGLNWCVASSAHDCLVIHAAVVERGGKAVILPGTPGSGKSTLCAALINRGWRLLSDEMTLVGLDDGLIRPFPRPVSLKNESIDVIEAFAREAIMGEVVRDTTKGTVGHLRPPDASVHDALVRATPAVTVFPKYRAGAGVALTAMSRGYAFMEVASNSFNYHVLGHDGFDALTALMGAAESYSLDYSNLDDALAAIGELVQ
jgi:HprK-related kinase A